ncbi:MAG: hypothetical protein NZP34_14480, partial [Caldilineales bacterium]|nr:hypothetical protein [Caldilineales bacterium]
MKPHSNRINPGGGAPLPVLFGCLTPAGHATLARTRVYARAEANRRGYFELPAPFRRDDRIVLQSCAATGATGGRPCPIWL